MLWMSLHSIEFNEGSPGAVMVQYYTMLERGRRRRRRRVSLETVLQQRVVEWQMETPVPELS